jgi:GTP cyclohydrolase I
MSMSDPHAQQSSTEAGGMAETSTAVLAAQRLLEEGFQKILEGFGKLGYPVNTDDNFRETAARAAKGLRELVLPIEEIDASIQEMLEKTFSAQYDEMVVSKHNVAFGVCPHHLLPVIYRISMAYLPNERVLGISKLSRLAHLLARRPALQEALTQELAVTLYQGLSSKGAAVYIEGLHMCMASRGIQAHEARVVTSAVRGVFRDQQATRTEFLNLVTATHPNLI